ncbi:MAG: hypothetical protein Q8906_15425 [Bacillota bacterium]|nr:hypothetical protein [Bacillota bacterium]MDP4171999.1 hypothetical protein [Bacillota bacterium]
MPEQLLEFRGINRKHLEMYFTELGGKQMSDSLPNVLVGKGWRGEILDEQELSFTNTFKVNAVRIRFYAEDECLLKELIKNYRYKTTRIGG